MYCITCALPYTGLYNIENNKFKTLVLLLSPLHNELNLSPFVHSVLPALVEVMLFIAVFGMKKKPL